MVSRFLTIALFSTLLAHASFAEEVPLDGLAAVVNKDVITFSDVRQLVGTKEQALRQTYRGDELLAKVKEGRLAAINDLVDRQLVLQEFEKNKFQVPEFVIDGQIASIIRDQFGGDRQAFIRTLQAQNFTIQRFRKMEKERWIVQQMRARSVKVSPIVPPGKIEAYYKANAAQFSQPEELKLRMIVLKSGNADSKKIADDIRAKMKTGGDFGKLAEAYSEGAAKENGGDWGWIQKNTLNESLSTPAFALKTGQVSDNVEVGDNLYLLYAEARRGGSTKPLAEVRKDIANKILQETRQEAQEKWIQGLRSKAFVKIY